MAEEKDDGVALSVAKRGSNVQPMRLYKDLQCPVVGKGHCEVTHKEEAMPKFESKASTKKEA